jgi:hypothetical protein
MYFCEKITRVTRVTDQVFKHVHDDFEYSVESPPPPLPDQVPPFYGPLRHHKSGHNLGWGGRGHARSASHIRWPPDVGHLEAASGPAFCLVSIKSMMLLHTVRTGDEYARNGYARKQHRLFSKRG